VRESDDDQVTVIGAGVTLAEANKAAVQLAAEGINIRVIDPFTIKPLDAETVIAAARKTGGKIITVEDHYPEGRECATAVLHLMFKSYSLMVDHHCR
jgi:transketolase